MEFVNISVLLCYIILTDMLFACALGASHLYKMPESAMTYPVYVKRIWKYSVPFVLFKRCGGKVRKTRHYALYIVCAAFIYGVTYHVFNGNASSIAPALFAAALLQAMCYVDMRTRYLPDIFMLPALLYSIIIGCTGIYLPVISALIGGAVGFGIMWGINALFKLIRKKDGMGAGDFLLMGLLGLWTGPWVIPYILFLSSFIGLGGAILYAVCTRKGLPEKFAYGPALAVAGWGIFLAMHTPAGRAFFIP